MKRGYLISIIILTFLAFSLLPLVNSTCTITFNKESYSPTEIVTAEITCSEAIEKSKDYSINWSFNGVDNYEWDTGTTPSTTGENFYETFILNSTYAGAINASMNGTNLEGETSANVTGASANSLLITNSSFGGGYIGLVASIQAIVKDENGKKISGGRCLISGWSNDETQMVLSKETFIVDGEVKAEEILSKNRFDEGTDYAYKILCYCGGNGSNTGCIDEDGLTIEDSIGSLKSAFTTLTWLEVNTLTDKSLYNPKQEIFICANLTNVNYSSRIPVHIYNQIRCSAGIDNSNDTDRALIVSDGNNPDERGISVGITQMQCKRFIIPDAKYLQGKTSECYASTTVWVLDEKREKLLGYATTSPVFNITMNNLQLYAKWEKIEDYKWNAIVDLSKTSYQEYSGIGTGNVQIHLAHPDLFNIDSIDQYDGYEMPFNNLLLAEQISNITATNSTGDSLTTSLHYKKQGQLDLYVESVDISPTGWYNVTINLNSFEERQTEALEGIENKTGTFHLDVDCPTFATIGEAMRCQINAYVEDSQLMEKEVDFTCYISEDGQRLSALNFNKMITRVNQNISKEFLIPSTFSDSTQHTLQCHANYYNLGSRQDSFYDTFISLEIPPQGTIGVAVTDDSILDKAKDIIDKVTDTGKAIKDKLFSTTAWIICTVVGGFVFVFLIILMIVLLTKKKETYIS